MTNLNIGETLMAKFNYTELYKDEPGYNKNEKFDADWAVWTKDNVLFVRFEGTKSVKTQLWIYWHSNQK